MAQQVLMRSHDSCGAKYILWMVENGGYVLCAPTKSQVEIFPVVLPEAQESIVLTFGGGWPRIRK